MPRPAPRWLSRLALFAALVAAAAGVVLPGLHGTHASHAMRAMAIETAAAAAIVPPAPHDAALCPLCAALGQARVALAPATAPALPARFTGERVPTGRFAAPPQRCQHAPCAPRAPPALA